MVGESFEKNLEFFQFGLIIYVVLYISFILVEYFPEKGHVPLIFRDGGWHDSDLV